MLTRDADGHAVLGKGRIDAALAIFTAAPDEARVRLRAAQVDYLLVCPADPDLQFFARHAPDGLIAEILRGDAPSWLQPAGQGGATAIYRVHRD